MGPDLQQILVFCEINHYKKFLKDFKEWVKKVICLETPGQHFLDLFYCLSKSFIGANFQKTPTSTMLGRVSQK